MSIGAVAKFSSAAPPLKLTITPEYFWPEDFFTGPKNATNKKVDKDCTFCACVYNRKLPGSADAQITAYTLAKMCVLGSLQPAEIGLKIRWGFPRCRFDSDQPHQFSLPESRHPFPVCSTILKLPLRPGI